MRFFYYYPTWDKPSGGSKQLRLQATLLRELGVETFLLRDEEFFTRANQFDDNTFYKLHIPHASFPFKLAGDHLSADDLLILPEVRLADWLAVCSQWKCRIAVNNQNGFYGLRYGTSRYITRKRIEFVIANAPYVAALSHHFYGLSPNKIFHVPHWIVRAPFDFSPRSIPAELAVAFMPRKLSPLVQQVRDMVRLKEPQVPWIEIDGMPEPKVAEVMRKCKVFFAAQDLEGCPLTALEAMTCHAIVAGFPGTARFPHPYAISTNGYWAADRNPSDAAVKVLQAIQLARTGGESYQQMLDSGHQTALKFSKEVVLESLTEMIEVTRSQRYSTRLSLAPKLGIAGWLQAGRLMYDYDRLGTTVKAIGSIWGKAKILMKGDRDNNHA